MTVAGEFPVLRRGDGVPLWRQVATALAEELGHLDAEDGERRLPTERELAGRFGVNRHTIRQAVRALAEQGLVRTEQGRGTFALVDYPLGTRTRFTASLLAQDRAPGHEVLAVEVGPAPAACAAALGLTPGEPVLERRAVGLADGVPLAVGSTWFPLARFPDGREGLLREASVTAFLAARGFANYRRRTTRVLARPADAEEARRLRQPAGAPVLVTEAVDVDAGGAPVSFSVTAWASGRIQLVVEAG